LQGDAKRFRGLSDGSVRGYRGGYLPSQRREIERGLREGAVRGVIATNALELGIDIGQLDICIMAGYPGTIASTWQQAGRAGRRNALSAAFLVASASPLDQYLVTHPDYFFGRSPEHVLINPNNLIILANHLRCAAFELPFRQGEAFGNLSADETVQILDYLAGEGALHQVAGTYHWMSENYPAEAVSLRSADADSFAIMDAAVGNRVIGVLDRFAAPVLIHEGAIYLHEGSAYQVEKLDWEARQAFVRPTDADYYTEANQTVSVNVLDTLEEEDLGESFRARGEVVITARATTFRKVRFYTQEILGYGEINLPEQEMHTTAYWWALAKEVDDDLIDMDRGPNWAEQRRRARDRDRFTCRVCGAGEASLGREHDVHHIRPFREFGYIAGQNEHHRQANELDNLITLCRTCHSRVSGDRVSKDAFSNGLRGLAYLLHHVAPLYLMCEPQDLGVVSELRSPLTGRPTIYIYDQVPAGVGFSEALYRLHRDLLTRAYEVLGVCACSDGCPSCVGPSAAGGEGGKQAAAEILRQMLE
jgi:DEAD/DEAH box helicase domain-containing protein